MTEVGRRFRELMEQYEREEREQDEARFVAWCWLFHRSKRNPANITRDVPTADGVARLTVFLDRGWWKWCAAGAGGAQCYSPTSFGDALSALRDLWEALGRP